MSIYEQLENENISTRADLDEPTTELINSLGYECVLDNVLSALDTDTARDVLQYIAQCYDL